MLAAFPAIALGLFVVMNRIRCPTDVSAEANGACAYAPDRSQRGGALLHLLHRADDIDP